MSRIPVLSLVSALALEAACTDAPVSATQISVQAVAAAPPAAAAKGAAGDRFARCLASCEANNKNVKGHEWVEKYVEGPGYAAYSACLDEAVKQGTTAAKLGCTEKGTQACARACAAD